MSNDLQETAEDPASAAGNSVCDAAVFTADFVKALNRLLVRALIELDRVAIDDEGCRIAGEGWALLRHGYPQEADRLNAVLHSLTRSRCSSKPKIS